MTDLEPIAIMFTFGAAWGFFRLMGDAIIGAFNLSVWVRRKIVERSQ